MRKEKPEQLTLFESGKPDNKMREVSRKEITLGTVIYQGTKRRKRPRRKYLVASSNGLKKRFCALDPRKYYETS